MMMPVSRPSIVIIPNLRARVRKSMYGIPAMSGRIPQMAAMRMGMNPRHATANTTTKYIAVKIPTLMRPFPVNLPPVFDVEADVFPVIFMCESFPLRLFGYRAFYEVSHMQQQSILMDTRRAATPSGHACSKKPCAAWTTTSWNVWPSCFRLIKQSIFGNVSAAQRDDIVAKLPWGMDAVYGAQDSYLSDGEVRCLMLACAILKDAEVVVLDEAIRAIRSTTSRGMRAFS